MQTNKAFAQRLTEALRLKDLSHAVFAKKLGCAKSTITHYCLGLSDPSVAMLIKICKELGESADYLLGLTDDWASFRN